MGSACGAQRTDDRDEAVNLPLEAAAHEAAMLESATLHEAAPLDPSPAVTPKSTHRSPSASCMGRSATSPMSPHAPTMVFEIDATGAISPRSTTFWGTSGSFNINSQNPTPKHYSGSEVLLGSGLTQAAIDALIASITQHPWPPTMRTYTSSHPSPLSRAPYDECVGQTNLYALSPYLL